MCEECHGRAAPSVRHPTDSVELALLFVPRLVPINQYVHRHLALRGAASALQSPWTANAGRGPLAT